MYDVETITKLSPRGIGNIDNRETLLNNDDLVGFKMSEQYYNITLSSSAYKYNSHNENLSNDDIFNLCMLQPIN